jgi:cobalt-zinc-cadmium efflux system outer membrane protein
MRLYKFLLFLAFVAVGSALVQEARPDETRAEPPVETTAELPPVQVDLRDSPLPNDGQHRENALPGVAASPGLTLQDLEAIAEQHNPTLCQAAMAIQAAEGQLVQAGLYPNPNLFYVADEIGNDGSQGLQGAGIGQEFITAHKRHFRQATAGSRVAQTTYAWQAQRYRVLNDVYRGFYNVLLAQKTIEANEQLVRIGDGALKTTERLRAAQAVSLAVVLQARIEAQTARISLNRARNRHQAAWRQLAAVVGCPDMPSQRLLGDVASNLPELTWEETLGRLMSQSPELAEAQAGVERAQHNLGLQSAARYPNFFVESAVKYDTGSRFTVADVAVTVPLPVFNRNQGNILSAQSSLIAAEKELQRVELDLRNRLAETFERYANARRQVDTYQQSILPDAKKSLELVSTGYREGEFDFLTLLTAQRTYFFVNLDYLASLALLWDTSVDLEGLLLRDSLSGGTD